MPGPGPPQQASFGGHWLAQRLACLLPAGAAPPRLICVAWSGGADSTALLAALAELRGAARAPWSVRAIHVDHHLQPAAADFRAQCRRVSRLLGVPLTVLDARIGPLDGRSPEEVARDVRYALLARALRPGEWLLTAQHAEDQLETVLLQLLRGAGVAGLAAMPERSAFGAGVLLRPLLGVSGAALRGYLQRRGIGWSEDPTNRDPRFDRNYLRLHVLPPLLARWPAAPRTVARSARHLGQAAALLRRQGSLDAAAAADGAALDLAVLRRLSQPRQAGALRSWIEGRGFALPDERRLAAVLGLAELRADATPLVQWAGVAVRRHRDRLLVLALAGSGAPGSGAGPLQWSWQRQRRLVLPQGGVLELRTDPWGDVDLERLPPQLVLRWRAGGERGKAAQGHRDVKQLLREADIPAWERGRVPLVCASAAHPGAGPVLAIADLWIAAAIRSHARTRQRGRFVWQQQ